MKPAATMIRRESLTDQTASAIREAILDGTLPHLTAERLYSVIRRLQEEVRKSVRLGNPKRPTGKTEPIMEKFTRALPIVRATGGLDDTVENYDEAAGKGTGFKFWEISDRALYYTIGWAVSTWYDRPHHIAAMRDQGMGRDFTWEASARQYESVYEKALSHRLELQGAPSK